MHEAKIFSNQKEYLKDQLKPFVDSYIISQNDVDALIATCEKYSLYFYITELSISQIGNNYYQIFYNKALICYFLSGRYYDMYNEEVVVCIDIDHEVIGLLQISQPK